MRESCSDRPGKLYEAIMLLLLVPFTCAPKPIANMHEA